MMQQTQRLYVERQVSATIYRKRWSDMMVFLMALMGYTLLGGIYVLIYDAFNLVHPFAFFAILNASLLTVVVRGWMGGTLDTFHPYGLFSLYGIHMFFVTPILWVLTDASMPPWLNNPPDWRVWFLWVEILYLPSILFLVYRYTLVKRYQKRERDKINNHLFLDLSNVYPLILVLIFLSLGVFMWMLKSRGGIQGLMQLYVLANYHGERHLVAGMGLYLSISGWIPVLLALWWGNRQRQRGDTRWNWYRVLFWVGIALVFSPMVFFGSRSSFVGKVLMIFAVLYGFGFRIDAKRVMRYILLFVLPFLYVWGFYKDMGKDFFEYVSRGEFQQILDQSHRSWQTLLFGDLSRMDIQAYLVFKYLGDNPTYKLRYGKTYVNSIGYGLIPRLLWKDKPSAPARVDAGTDLLFWEGAHTLGKSSRVYGLAGEGLLNFGLIGFVLMPLLWVQLVYLWDCESRKRPLWIMLRAVWGVALFRLMTGDSDLWMVGLVREGVLLVTVLVIFSGILSRSAKDRRTWHVRS